MAAQQSPQRQQRQHPRAHTHEHFERQRRDCSPYTALLAPLLPDDAEHGNNNNGNGSGINGKPFNPFLTANFVSAKDERKRKRERERGSYNPPDYVDSLLFDWKIWSVNNSDTQRESLTLRQPFPLAVGETIERLKHLFGQKVHRVIGRQPLLHAAIAHGLVMLFNNPAIRTLETVHARWYERDSAACQGSAQEEIIRGLLETNTPLSLRTPSSPQRSGKSDMTIYVRPEVRKAVATLKPSLGMTLQDFSLLCACTWFGALLDTPPNYREELREEVDDTLQLISYKARVVNTAIAEFHADMGLEWDPKYSIWPGEYTPHLELLDALQMEHHTHAEASVKGEGGREGKEKTVGGEVM